MKTVLTLAFRILLLAVLLLPGQAAAQSDDRGFLTRLLEDNLSGAGRSVTITGFAGALSSRATIKEITIADDQGIWLTLRDVAIRWTRSALLAGRIEIDELSAAEIVMPRGPQSTPAMPTAEARGFSLPDLPVSVRIGSLRAEKVSLGAAVVGTDAVVTLDGSMNLSRGEGDARLAIDRIDGRDGAFDLNGSYSNATGLLVLDLGLTEGAGGIVSTAIGLPGAPALALSLRGAGPLADYTADIALATEGQDRLTGRITTQTGETAARRFSADIGGDIAPLFAPEYRDFFGPDIRMIAEGTRGADGRLDLSTLALRAREIALDGRVVIGSDGLPELIDLTGTVQGAAGRPVLLPLPGPRTLVDRVGLSVSFDAAQGDDWRGAFDVRGLNRPDLRIATLGLSGTGRIVRGAVPSVSADLDFTASGLVPVDPALATALGPQVSGAARFMWQDGSALDLLAFTLTGADYSLTAQGSFNGLAEDLRATGTVSAQLADLSRFSALAGRPLSGAANAEISGTVAPLAGTFDLTTTLSGRDLAAGQAELDRLLAGQSRVAASVARTAGGVTIRALTVSAGSLTAIANGTLRTGGSDLAATLSLTDLSIVRPQFGGSLRGAVQLSESGTAQTITASATGAGLRVGQPQADALLRGTSTLSLAAVRDGDTVTVQDFRLNAATLSAQVAGVLRAGASRLSATLDFSDLAVLGAGFSGGLTARADLAETGTLRELALTGTARDLAVNQPQADRVLRGQTALLLNATEDRGTIAVQQFRLTNPQLSATATAEQTGADRRISVDARLADLAQVAPGFPGPLTLTGAITQTAARYGVDLRAAGPGGIAAEVTGTLAPDLRSVDLAVTGAAQTALLNSFLGERSVQGPVRYDLRMRGAPGLAALTGTVQATNNRVVDPERGIAVEGLDVSARLASGRAEIQGSGRFASGGSATIAGPVSLSEPYTADLTIALSRALLRDPELFSTEITGPVTIAGPLAGGARISGSLVLSATELRVPSTGLGGADPIPDLIHLNEPAAVRETRARAGLLDTGQDRGAPARPYPLDLTISAPQQVFIRGRGLDAELGGSIRLTGTTADVVPIGQFSLIRGRLDILGKRFTLSEGSAFLEGRFVPYVRLVASTESDGVTSSIVIEGQATEPVITFSAVPELPQEEVLARLLFGRSLTSMSPLQAAQMASAVATLAGRGGEGIVSRLRTGFGLDDLDVVTDADGNAAVRAGKYLATNVYTDITLGTEGNTEVNLNLDLSPAITLRGSAVSDGNTSVGIFYERDY